MHKREVVVHVLMLPRIPSATILLTDNLLIPMSSRLKEFQQLSLVMHIKEQVAVHKIIRGVPLME
jgi:hypothetical protein